MTDYESAPDRSTEFEAVGARADIDTHPRFDVDFRYDTGSRDGELTVFLGLDAEECEAIWAGLKQDDDGYPVDIRERIFESLGFDV